MLKRNYNPLLRHVVGILELQKANVPLESDGNVVRISAQMSLIKNSITSNSATHIAKVLLAQRKPENRNPRSSEYIATQKLLF